MQHRDFNGFSDHRNETEMIIHLGHEECNIVISIVLVIIVLWTGLNQFRKVVHYVYLY